MGRKSSPGNKFWAFSFNHFTWTQPALSAGISAPAQLMGTIIFQINSLPLNWCIMGEYFRHQSYLTCHCTGRFFCHVIKILTAFSCSSATLIKTFYSIPEFIMVQLFNGVHDVKCVLKPLTGDAMLFCCFISPPVYGGKWLSLNLLQ